MFRKLLMPLLFIASPVLAQPLEDKGYALGCDEGGCTVFSAGFFLYVTPDGGTPAALYDTLAGLDMVTAVDVKGELGELGDMTADMKLSALSVRKDDPYQETLRVIQGGWKPKGEETPFEIQLYGFQWQELTSNEVSGSYVVMPGSACADGKAQEGVILSLANYGSEPSEAACWKVEQASDSEMVLRDLRGQQGQVTYVRPY